VNRNLHTLLNGPLFGLEDYLVACALQALNFNTIDKATEKTQEDLIASVQSNSPINNSSKNVVVLSFNQPVVKYDYNSWLGSKTLIKIIDQIEANPDVIGLVMDIDSGGGQVYGTAELYDRLVSFNKPYVAYTDGYMCSAAYYMAAPADKIVVNKRADHIGSIGAYGTIVDINGILQHFGAKVHSIYADESPEKNKEYREVIKNSNDTPYKENVLSPIVKGFQNDMKAVRPGLDAKVYAGGTWNGLDAVSLGLADANGSLNDAILEVFNLYEFNLNTNNTMSSTKDRPRLQNVLQLESPLASTEAGSYLNDEQLDAIESHIKSSETAFNTSQDELNTANERIETLENSIAALAENAGISTDGADKQVNALTGYLVKVGKEDSGKVTAVKVKPETENQANNTVIGGIDVSEYLNS
jgi:ClpP class serine protease